MSHLKIENGVCWKCWLKYSELRSCCALCGAQLLPFIEAAKQYSGFMELRQATVNMLKEDLYIQGELFQDED